MQEIKAKIKNNNRMTIFGVWYGIKNFNTVLWADLPMGFFWLGGGGNHRNSLASKKGDFLKKAGFLNQTGAQPRPESMKRIKKVILLGRQNFRSQESFALLDIGNSSVEAMCGSARTEWEGIFRGSCRL